MSQGAGKRACVAVALEREIFTSHKAREHGNYSESNAVCASDCLDARLSL